MAQSEVAAFSGWYGSDYGKFYEVVFYSNRERVVHLGLKLYIAATGALTQRVDVLWDMTVNVVGAYIEPSYLAEVWADLDAIFRGAEMKTIRFSAMIAHYSMPNLSGNGSGGNGSAESGECEVRASVSRANGAPFGVALGAGGGRLELAVAFVPSDVDTTNIYHYAALCKHGWTKVSQGVPSGACPAAYWKNMKLLSNSPAGAKVPMLTVGFRGAPEREVGYKSCFFCVQCMQYCATTQTMEFLVLGKFSGADPSTPYGNDLTFTIRFSWDLTRGIVYFPAGSLERAARFMFMAEEGYRRAAATGAGEPFARQCWLTKRYVFSGILQEMYGWNVPRVLWNASDAVYLAREIVGDLAWLSAFRGATRGRLPESVYHRIGLAEVPKSVRRAYGLGEVLPGAKRRRCGAGGGSGSSGGAAALLE
jgi:hypothetical protein